MKKLPSMLGGSDALVMWGESGAVSNISATSFRKRGTFEPCSLGVVVTGVLILFPSAKIAGMTARFRAVEF